MIESGRPGALRLFHFLLLPQFSMLAFTSCVEALRTANRLSGRSLYAWTLLSMDGDPARASNGIQVLPDRSMEAPGTRSDAIVVCSGVRMEGFRDSIVLAWLRRQARTGAALGGLCTGALVLARAGLLDRRRCTLHWENMESFAEEFPDLEITATLFEIDGDRFTCAGGAAALDMTIALIRAEHGTDLAATVADALIHTRVRNPDDPQRLALRDRVGVSQPKVLAAIACMEANLETPLTLDDLATDVGVSARQLERLFQKHMRTTPARYYLSLRLWRARALLQQTPLTVLQVAVASGFTSASHFSRCYRAFFGHAPKRGRSNPEATRPAPLPSFGGRGAAPPAPLPPPETPADTPFTEDLRLLGTLDPEGEATVPPDLAAALDPDACADTRTDLGDPEGSTTPPS